MNPDLHTWIVLGVMTSLAAVWWFYRRLRWKSQDRSFDRQLARIRAGEKPEVSGRDATFEIQIVPDGFAIIPLKAVTEKPVRCPWAGIVAVTAYKRDLVVHDEVCLRVELEDGSAVEADESMRGWCELGEALPLHLDGARTFGWYLEITVPAFEPCVTPVYQRV